MEPRITLITLGVADLPRAVRFYRDGLGWPTLYDEGGPVAFFETSGTRLALYPMRDLAADISPEVPTVRDGFSGITLAHNARSKAEVDAVLKTAEQAGAKIVKPAQDVFWGGYSGYFRDLDGHYWEVAWNPILPLDEKGFMNLRPQGEPPPTPTVDGFSKVENALRLCLIAAIAAFALFIVGQGVTLVIGTHESAWYIGVMLAVHVFLAAVVIIPAYMVWRKMFRELINFGVFGAAVVLNLFLMILPNQLGLFEWFRKRAFDSSSWLILDAILLGILFYLQLIFPFRAASWFYRKVSGAAHRLLFRRRQVEPFHSVAEMQPTSSQQHGVS